MMLWATNDGLVAPNKGNQKLDEKFLQARLTSLKKVSIPTALFPLSDHFRSGIDF